MCYNVYVNKQICRSYPKWLFLFKQSTLLFFRNHYLHLPAYSCRRLQKWGFLSGSAWDLLLTYYLGCNILGLQEQIQVNTELTDIWILSRKYIWNVLCKCQPFCSDIHVWWQWIILCYYWSDAVWMAKHLTSPGLNSEIPDLSKHNIPGHSGTFHDHSLADYIFHVYKFACCHDDIMIKKVFYITGPLWQNPPVTGGLPLRKGQ